MIRYALIALTLASAARADVAVSASITVGGPVEVATFRERLAPYGRWMFVAGYGDVWVPAGVRAGWRPYSDGRWVLTEYGWTFVSDEPWGWAAWHYGNWVFAGGAGWVWVPGRVWAPAWVIWRRGGGYAAWSPAPPAFISVRVRPAWVVVEERHFTEPIARVTVSETFVQRTQVIGRAQVNGGVAVNPGPHPTAIAAAVGHPVTAVQAHAVIGRGTAAIATAPGATVHPNVTQRWQRQDQRVAQHDQVRAQRRAARMTQPPPAAPGRRRSRR